MRETERERAMYGTSRSLVRARDIGPFYSKYQDAIFIPGNLHTDAPAAVLLCLLLLQARRCTERHTREEDELHVYLLQRL